MRRRGSRGCLVVIAASLLLLVGLVSPVAVRADSIWPISLTGEMANSVNAVLTHGDGSVSVLNNGFQTYSANGLLSTDLSSSDVYAASIWAAAGIDGTTYTNYNKFSYGQQISSGLAAYKNGVRVWATAFTPCSTGGSNLYPYAKWIKLGYGGDIFAIVASKCVNVASQLIRVNSADGSVVSSISLGSTAFEGTAETNDRLWVMPEGVRVLDDNILKTFDNSLSLSFTQTVSLAPGELLGGIAGSDGAGDVYLVGAVSDSNCNSVHMDNVYRLSVDNTQQTIPITQSCVWPLPLRITPDGGMVFLDTKCYYSSCYSVLYSLAVDGSLRFSMDLSVWGGHTNVSAAYPQVDANGSIIISQRGTSSVTGRGSDLQVIKVDPAGVATQVFMLDNASDPVGGYFTAAASLFQELDNGVLYLPVCTNGWYCGGNYPPMKLYKAAVPGLAMDYPRSAVFAALSTRLKYVAMGDSFSSGQGNRDANGHYLGQSDADGCNRSNNAYPELLNGLGPASLLLTNFVACSGATTADVENGKNGEPSQLAALDASTDVVTITIGGNDVGFSDFAAHCAQDRCGSGSQAYQEISDRIYGNLEVNQEYLFEEIAAKAPNATIYVIGYPPLTPASWQPECPAFLDQPDGDIGGDTEGASLVVSAINQVTSQAVAATGLGRVHFIDPGNGQITPFANHDLCSAWPFFSGIVLGDLGSSFHPDVDGHIAYANVALAGMS